MFHCNKLPCLGWRSADFLQVFFAQNVCKSSSNMRVLVLRFLWLFTAGLPDFSCYCICTKTAQNIPSGKKIYRMAIEYGKWPKSMYVYQMDIKYVCQHLPLQGPTKFTQIWTFDFNIYHLATLIRSKEIGDDFPHEILSNWPQNRISRLFYR
jgi:hypothetical protein